MPVKSKPSTSAKITSVWPPRLPLQRTSARPVGRTPGGGRGPQLDGNGYHHPHGRLAVVEDGGPLAGHRLVGLVGSAALEPSRLQVRVLVQGAVPALLGVDGAERTA